MFIQSFRRSKSELHSPFSTLIFSKRNRIEHNSGRKCRRGRCGVRGNVQERCSGGDEEGSSDCGESYESDSRVSIDEEEAGMVEYESRGNEEVKGEGGQGIC